MQLKKFHYRQLLVVLVLVMFALFCMLFPHIMIASCFIIGFIFFVIAIPGLVKKTATNSVDITQRVYHKLKKKDASHDEHKEEVDK